MLLQVILCFRQLGKQVLDYFQTKDKYIWMIKTLGELLYFCLGFRHASLQASASAL